jgi:hypothetical protein
MKAKEKAKELFDEMCLAIATEKTSDGYFTNVIHAKQCALICVEQIRSFDEKLFYASKGSLFDKYLDNVKQEIEKL